MSPAEHLLQAVVVAAIAGDIDRARELAASIRHPYVRMVAHEEVRARLPVEHPLDPLGPALG